MQADGSRQGTMCRMHARERPISRLPRPVCVDRLGKRPLDAGPPGVQAGNRFGGLPLWRLQQRSVLGPRAQRQLLWLGRRTRAARAHRTWEKG
jgi:hypothetical protein